MSILGFITAILAFGNAPAVQARTCTQLFTPNDFLSGSCKISGDSTSASDFANICSSKCIQETKGYIAALRAACGAAGNIEAARIQAGCDSLSSSSNIRAMFGYDDEDYNKCVSDVDPNKFLSGNCRFQGSDFYDIRDNSSPNDPLDLAGYERLKAGPCSNACASQFSFVLSSFYPTCGNTGLLIQQRFQDACDKASKF